MPHPTAHSAVLPSLIRSRAEGTPNDTFAIFPAADGSITRITFLDYARACWRFGGAISTTPLPTGHPVGIVAVCDTLSYIAAIGGLTSAGLPVFPISHRLTPAAVVHLLRSVSARRLIVTHSTLPTFIPNVRDAITEAGFDIIIDEMPPLTELYPRLTSGVVTDEHEATPVPDRAVFTTGVEVYLHSSGSTGLPKPIPYSHEFVRRIQYQECFNTYPKDMTLNSAMLPSFHAMGFWFQIMHPLLTGRPTAIFEPQYPQAPVLATLATTIDGIIRTKSTAVFVVPAFLEAWAHEPEATNVLKSLDLIAYAGGPLSQESGDKLVEAGCRIVAIYGSTEGGCITRYHESSRDPKLWSWVEFANHVKPRWIPYGDFQTPQPHNDTPHLQELELLTCETHQLAVENLADLPGYATQDLWARHPEYPNLWKPVGRADDVIVMANGEKTVPGVIEGAICAHPLVQGAVAFGRGREQIGVLVEPNMAALQCMTLDQIKDEIWPSVEGGNAQMPAFSRVFKEMILMTSYDKPLPRADKVTVNRKGALMKYADEINALYVSLEIAVSAMGPSRPIDWRNFEQLAEWLSGLASTVLGLDVDRECDIFVQGYDSLTATLLRRRITSALRDGGDAELRVASGTIAQDFVYTHPTIVRMARALSCLGTEQQTQGITHKELIDTLVEEYTSDIPLVTNTPRRSGRITVLLTGSTGHLGTHILFRLLQDERVARVYAFNRPSQRGERTVLRHKRAFRDHGIDVACLMSSKLSFLEGEAHEMNLGLSDGNYLTISNTVDAVIHNAWNLDFNLDVQAFADNITSTRRLVDFAATSARGARVLFSSSIAVASNWNIAEGLFPEEVPSIADSCLNTGYGESKFIAEQILASARNHGLNTTSLRLGQITGNRSSGAWSPSDWVPIMVKSSVALGALPDAKGIVSWISPEAVADAFADALFSTHSEPLLNICHSQPVPWTQVVTEVANGIVEHGITSDRLPLIPFDKWLSLLEARDDDIDAKTLKTIPALKLLPFFTSLAKGDLVVRNAHSDETEATGLPVFDTRKARSVCASLREQPCFTHSDASRWIGYWKTKNMF